MLWDYLWVGKLVAVVGSLLDVRIVCLDLADVCLCNFGPGSGSYQIEFKGIGQS